MFRWLLLIMVVAAFGLLMAEENAKNSAEKVMEALKKIQKLKKMTSFLNLLNGLYLSEEQMKKIVEVNREYQKEMEEWAEKYAERVEKWLKVMEEWVAVLKEGKLPKDLMRRAGHVDHMLVVVKRNMLNRLKTKYKERLEGIFTDAQKEVIRTFEPCVVPPRDLRDPIRAGQAKAGGRFVGLLQRLRRFPPRLFWRELDKIVDRHVEGYAKAHPMTEEEKNAERKRLRELLIKIYRMDDVDFELQKNKLAEELKVRDKAHVIRDEIKRLNEELQQWQKKVMPGHFSPVVRWFLNPDTVIPVLESRLGKTEGKEKAAQPLPDKSRKTTQSHERGRIP